jgi:hypothetical protein
MISRRLRRSLLLSIVTILAACGPAQSTPATPTPSAKGFDLSAWNVSTIGSGPAATEANGGIDLFFPANARGDPQQQLLIAVSVTARCHLTGDFDLQADYSLVSWPPRNGVRFGLVAGADTVLRTSNPHSSDNTYSTSFSGYLTSGDTLDARGRLRLTRTGTTVTGYYLSNRTWVSIASASATVGASGYAIAAWTDSVTFGQRDVRVNLKNLTVTGCA